MERDNYKFTQEEWEACLKVLQCAKEDPNAVPDVNVFKGLITKIHKKAKKGIAQEQRKKALEENQKLLMTTQNVKIHHAQKSQDKNRDDIPTGPQEYQELKKPQKCYVCASSYSKLHFHYHLLCPSCAEFNFVQRNITNSLINHTALVTGARIKIGYETTLKLLRSGAKVIATSRFPKSALNNYVQEPDFEEWKDRLEVCGLDFRDILGVERFTEYIQQKYPYLEIIINNAAQTIKRENSYYQPLLEQEQEKLPISIQRNLGDFQRGFALLEQQNTQQLLEQTNMYPPQSFNYDGQPTDFRDKNSWVLPIQEVNTEELLEVHLINSIAPFMLNSRLHKTLLNSPQSKMFIVNVTSKEGIFANNAKNENHPHTNMSKASLNMMTLTSAEAYAKQGIFMNSVDPGWASHENPFHIQQKMNERGFVPPLDFVDAASRILSPIFDGLESDKPMYGKLLKNYQPIEW